MISSCSILLRKFYQRSSLGFPLSSVQDHVSKIQHGLDTADLILTTGGTSMGLGDLLKPVIERDFEGTIHFGRVKMKPGKPTTFATIPNKKAARGRHSTPIFALPGNPASALVTFYLFVVPALRKLGGWKPDRCQLPRIRVQVSSIYPPSSDDGSIDDPSSFPDSGHNALGPETGIPPRRSARRR